MPRMGGMSKEGALVFSYYWVVLVGLLHFWFFVGAVGGLGQGTRSCRVEGKLEHTDG